jgi:hypothetical protein
MLKKYISIVRGAALVGVLMCGASLLAQTTASGVINGSLNNTNGIAIQFDSDPAGVTLGAAGTNAATANFGTVSAFGTLAAGVTRPSVTAVNFTVRTIFDVQVVSGGLNSLTYTLTANLAAAAPAGMSYKVDAITLTTALQTIQVNGAYGTDIPHNLDLVILTAAPGAGGPALNTPITTTINFTATVN